MIVIHYTAGPSALTSVWHCQRPESAVSYHVIIGRKGQLYQLLPFNARGWHAGKSSFLDQSDCNSFSIGIGLANWGVLKRWPDGPLAAWPNDYTHFLPPDTPTFKAYHKCQEPPFIQPSPEWEPYSARQIFALRVVLRALFNAYPIEWIVGHDDIAPRRKLDPGPAFPLLPVQPLDVSILTSHANIALMPGHECTSIFSSRYYCPWCHLHFAPETLSDAQNDPHAPAAPPPYEVQACPVCSNPLTFLI